MSRNISNFGETEKTDITTRWNYQVLLPQLIPVYLTAGGNKAARQYKILPFEVRQNLKFVETGKRLYLCCMFCFWTLGRFKCVWWHGLWSEWNWSRQTLLRFFFLFLLANLPSELPFLSPCSRVPGALTVQDLFAHVTTIYTRRGKKIFSSAGRRISFRKEIVFV